MTTGIFKLTFHRLGERIGPIHQVHSNEYFKCHLSKDSNQMKTKANIILDDCSAAEIANQTESSPVSGYWDCNLLYNGTSCGTGDITYIPTYGDSALNYCYGSGRIVISPAPTGPYELSWTSGAWVSFTGDYGSTRYGGSWLIQGTYYEVANSVKFSKYYMTRILSYSVKKIGKRYFCKSLLQPHHLNYLQFG